MGGGIIFAETINQGNVEVHLAASPLACPVSADFHAPVNCPHGTDNYFSISIQLYSPTSLFFRS